MLIVPRPRWMRVLATCKPEYQLGGTRDGHDRLEVLRWCYRNRKMSYKQISFLLSTVLVCTGAVAQAQVTPSVVTLGPSQTQQFSSSQWPVTWTVVPAGSGTITSTGLYQAAATYASNLAYVYAFTGSDSYFAQVNLSPTAVTSTSTPSPTSSQSISVTLSPPSIYLWGGQSQQFTASVSGSNNQQVRWAIVQGLGSIQNGLYLAPSTISAVSVVTISATSTAHPTKFATATIMLGPTVASQTTPALAPSPTTENVTISMRPASASLGSGQSKKFTVTVGGTSNTAVTWSLSPNIGSVTSSTYTAPASVTAAQTIQLTATSVEDPTQSTTSTVNLVPSHAAPNTPPSVSPATVTLAPSGTQQFSVQNLPAGVSVGWAISAPYGNVSWNGLYSAPSNGQQSRTLTITATNSSTQAVLGTAIVTIQPVVSQAAPPPPPASPSVSPATATVAPSGTQAFSVLNLPAGTTVAWAVSPATGSITASGSYSALSSVAAQSSITVTAKNSSTNAVLGTATLTLLASPKVSPATATVAPSGTQAFSVQNLPAGTTVAWGISPATGSITQSGSYSAPSSVAAQKTITVTATNASTNAVLGTATLTLQASPLAPSVSPATATVAPSGTQAFSVQNLPTGTTVAWAISPTTGSITASGSYSAPSSVAAQSSITVTATNSSTHAVLGTATLTLQASPKISPATATVAPSGTQAFSVQNLPTGTTVAWGISPATGSITQTGSYSAPSSVAAQKTITVTATNASTNAVLGTATLTLQASPIPPSVSPATANVAPSGTQAFSVQNLPTGTTVAWGISPATGSITQSGSYTAPSSVASEQTITVTATNASTNAVLGAASLNLQASPLTPVVSPATASVAPSGTQLFTVQNLPTGTTVAWTISPATGSITASGSYSAPSSVAAQSSITVTAKNSSTNAVLGTATLTLLASPKVSPATVTVAPSGSQQFSVQNLPAGTVVSWGISPSTGGITQNGSYSAPSNVPTQQSVTVTATNASTAAVLGTASVTLTASPAAAPTPTTITLPVEVVGPNGTTATASFVMPQGTNVNGQLQLWMQIHNLKYETEASVQVNNSAWLPISTGNVTLLGNAVAFGGIGGGFHTLQMTLNLPAGSITTGTNTLTFRFNATDGVTSGYRVLAFNIRSGGTNLLPASTFVNDDPNTWQSPSAASSDIAAGLALYQGASLTTASGAIKAHCSDCHTPDGRDLKYFNYSNNSIQARAVFHGLTAQQGNQIASYIRALNLPNPGRPWNPPYQPGPGLDSQPVANWSAGAGISAVLDNDSEMLPYLAPGGSTAGWAATAYLNPRELPLVMQLPDWNAWLPIIHPKDAFGASFTNSGLNTILPTIRGMLQPNLPTAYAAALAQFLIGLRPVRRSWCRLKSSAHCRELAEPLPSRV